MTFRILMENAQIPLKDELMGYQVPTTTQHNTFRSDKLQRHFEISQHIFTAMNN